MKLLFSTRDLEIGGRAIEGFPMLIDDDCMPLQPAQNFLLHALLESGSTRSKLTWEAVAHTSPFRPGPHFSKSMVIPLRRPTADTRHLVQAAVIGVSQIYKPGFKLSKAGVMLLDLMPDTASQGEFDFDAPETRDRSKLMAAMDAINDRFGRGAIHVGSAVGAGPPREWSMRQERLTPQYTTKWSDMPVARA